MPRGGGRSSSSRSSSSSSGFGSRPQSRGFSSSPNHTQAKSTPTYSQPSQPPMQMGGGGMLSGIGSTIMTGMAFGGGSEIGHQLVRSVTGGGSRHEVEQAKQQPIEPQNNQSQAQPQNNLCHGYNVKFIECLKLQDNDISSCQSFFDDLKACQKAMI